MRGQSEALEYILLSAFLVVIIVVAIVFLFGFEAGRVKTAQTEGVYTRAIFYADMLAGSGFLGEGGGAFDDSRLANFIASAGCEDLSSITGEDVCIEIESFALSEEKKECASLVDYPKCNKWVLCKDVCISEKGMAVVRLPVNIYRKMDKRTDLGLLTIRLRGS